MPAKRTQKRNIDSAKSRGSSGKKIIAKKTTKKETTKRPIKPTLPFDLKKAVPPKIERKFILIALSVFAIVLFAYRVGPWVFPVAVNNRPISRFELYKRLELAYGSQTLDDLINEKILDGAIKESGAIVDENRLAEELAVVEEQFKDLGGLDEALQQRGITRTELKKQISTQIAVEEILKDIIEPTEEDVQQEYDDNFDILYADYTLDEVREEITSTLKQANLRDAFLEWFAEVKQAAEVKRFSSTL